MIRDAKERGRSTPTAEASGGASPTHASSNSDISAPASPPPGTPPLGESVGTVELVRHSANAGYKEPNWAAIVAAGDNFSGPHRGLAGAIAAAVPAPMLQQPDVLRTPSGSQPRVFTLNGQEIASGTEVYDVTPQAQSASAASAAVRLADVSLSDAQYAPEEHVVAHNSAINKEYYGHGVPLGRGRMNTPTDIASTPGSVS